MGSFLFTVVIISVLHLSSCINLVKLDFYQDDGSSLAVSNPEDSDMTVNSSALVEFLQKARTACATGIWRFYPEVNFAYNAAGTFAGYQIGYDEKQRCFDISSGDLSEMSSYRGLGPYVELDLDQTSLTIYSGRFATGQSLSFGSRDWFPVLNIPTTEFPVESFVITGKHGNLTFSPVYQAFWDPDMNPENGTDPTTLCILLVAGEGEVILNMHFVTKMQYKDDSGAMKPIVMGSLDHHTYREVRDNSSYCPESWIVPKITISSPELEVFNEIPEIL